MQLDPRGPRFVAAVTTVVLIVVLVTSSAWLAAIQAVLFAVAVVAGPAKAPYALVYRKLIAPRLAPPTEREPAAPVRFAQAVGLVFVTVASVGYFAGVPLVGVVATGAAVIAAFLNAAFGLCLGCEMYLLYRRLAQRPIPNRTPTRTDEGVAA